MPIEIINNIKINYRVTGEGDPLLLIHGLGSSGRDWELQAGYFARHYRVITYDLRGHGQSSKAPGPYSVELFAEDTAKMLQKIDLPPAHVLGISLGGMVAFQLTLSFPQLVRSLIIVNSTPELIPRGIKDHLWILQRNLIVRLFGLRKIGQVLGYHFFPHDHQKGLRDIFIDRWGENHKRSYLEAMRAIYNWSVLDQLDKISIPTLVVGADGDYFPTADKEAYTLRIPGAELVIIDDARHALPAEKPAEFNQAVERFLDRIAEG
jgi:pimeloyl-ACP methyl ester carboxylesterase